MINAQNLHLLQLLIATNGGNGKEKFYLPCSSVRVVK